MPDHAGPKHRRSREEMRRIYMRRRAAFAAVVGIVALVVALALTSPGEPAGEGLSVVSETDAAEAADGSLAKDAKTVDRVLRYATHVREGLPGRPRVALTFDDGPGPDTDRILGILDRYGASATFFTLGAQMLRYPILPRRQLAAGHAIGGHTNDHARMGALPRAAQREQLQLQDAAFASVGSPEPRLFRSPYGSFDSVTMAMLERRRSLLVLWSVDTGDFASPGAEVIAERALEGADPGAIILMHDGPGPRPQTVEALPLILEGLRARRLKAVTVPKLLRTNPPPRVQPPPASLDGPG